MVEACKSEKRNSNNHQSIGIEADEQQSLCLFRYLPRSAVAGLISPNVVSHEKHFIVMSHSIHVTIKWMGREAPLPTLKGGRTNGRKARLLTKKMYGN
jgi:hypothetical protein